MNPLIKKHTQGPTERRTVKTFLSRVSLILWLQLTLLSVAWGQTPEPATTTAPLLTLEEAIRIASGTNRDIHISKFEINKAKEIVAQVRTNYLPKLDANVLAGAPLQPLNFRVPAGSLGTYPGTGPIPGKDSNIHSPVRFGAFVNASAAQPLTQLFKVNLAVKQARLGIDLAKEGVRAQSQETVRQVKEAYYQVAQLQAQVASARAGVQSLSELSTLTEQRLAQETVLLSDSLTVKAKLKQQRYQLLTAEDAFELQKQNLNRLLGRDLRTPFSVEMLPFGELVEWDLDTARKQALEQRPELRGARIQTNAVKPLLVFAAAPYGVIGSLIALAIMHTPFGFMAFLGIASLIGVIVSHVIVLFDFIEEMHAKGEPLVQALADAGIQRIRPVMITVGATILALFPLALEGGPLWQPLCYAQIGGLGVATFITLLLVPVLYSIFVLDLKIIRWEAKDSAMHDEVLEAAKTVPQTT
jgi:hypothetical protein